MNAKHDRDDLSGLPPGIREQFEDLLAKYNALAESSEDLRLTLTEIEEDARHDSATGAISVTAFFEELTRACALMKRHDIPVSVLTIELLQIDHLEQVYGADIPLQVLAQIADGLRQRVRTSDIIGRTEKHELSVILWYAEKFDCERRAGEIKREIEAQTQLEGLPPMDIRIAVGTATAVAHEPVDALMARARAKLARDRQQAA